MNPFSSLGSENGDICSIGAWAFDLDDLVDPPLSDSFDFFRRDFFGMSGKVCEDESDPLPNSLD